MLDGVRKIPTRDTPVLPRSKRLRVCGPAHPTGGDEAKSFDLGKNPLRIHQLSLEPQTLAECSTAVSCIRSKLICWYSIWRGTNPILRNKLRFGRAYSDWLSPALRSYVQDTAN